jgi:hypothetical protein
MIVVPLLRLVGPILCAAASSQGFFGVAAGLSIGLDNNGLFQPLDQTGTAIPTSIPICEEPSKQ